MNEDNRILYDIGNYKYTVSDVSKIYQDCKADIDNCDTNNLQFCMILFTSSKIISLCGP